MTEPTPHDNVDKSMRARQLASTVRQGRRITIDVLDMEPITGYLAGWDNDTYFILSPSGENVWKELTKFLVPKTNILNIRLYDERTLEEEQDWPQMQPIIQPFRDNINKNYKSQFTKSK